MGKSKAPPPVNRRGYWFKVWAEWFDSPAYRDLSMPARCLLLELHFILRPGRNGSLSISIQTAMERLGCAKQTAQNAFRELAAHGFIRLRKGELWQERKAREWSLTIERMGFSEPADDWARWEPGKVIQSLPRKQSPRKAA